MGRGVSKRLSASIGAFALAVLLASPGSAAPAGSPINDEVRRAAKAVDLHLWARPDGLVKASWIGQPLGDGTLKLRKALPVLVEIPNLAVLDLPSGPIQSLRGIEKLESLRHVEVHGSVSDGLGPLGRLPNLVSVRLSSSEIRSIAGLERAKRLERLVAYNLDLDDWRELSRLRNLRHLTLGNTNLDDLRVLASLRKLETLDVSSKTDDVSALGKLTMLRELDLRVDPSTDLRPLARLHSLERLRLVDMNGCDLSGLVQHPGLDWLELRDSDCTGWGTLANVGHLSGGPGIAITRGDRGVVAQAHISPMTIQELAAIHLDTLWPAVWDRERDWTLLAELRHVRRLVLPAETLTSAEPLARLTDLEELDLSLSGIGDLGPIARLPKLHTLSLGWTPVTSLTALNRMSTLRRLHLHGTRIKDLSPLAGMRLQVLDLRSTPVQDIRVLHGMRSLRYVDLRGSKVSQRSAAALRKALPKAKVLGPEWHLEDWSR